MSRKISFRFRAYVRQLLPHRPQPR